MIWKIFILPGARKHLAEIRDRRVRAKIEEAVLSLSDNPHLRGKPLLGEMLGYRSIRAAGQRYRIIYRIDRSVVTVVIVTVGRRKASDRKDVYELARRLIRLGLADPRATYRPRQTRSKPIRTLAANARK